MRDDAHLAETFDGLAVLTITYDRNTGDLDVNWDGMSVPEAVGLLTLALREAELPIFDDIEEGDES